MSCFSGEPRGSVISFNVLSIAEVFNCVGSTWQLSVVWQTKQLGDSTKVALLKPWGYLRLFLGGYDKKKVCEDSRVQACGTRMEYGLHAPWQSTNLREAWAAWGERP